MGVLAAALALAVVRPAEGAAPPPWPGATEPLAGATLAVGWRRSLDQAAATGVLRAAGAVRVGRIPEIAVDIVRAPNGGDLGAIEGRLEASPLVAFVERPPRDWRVAALTPNDPLRRTQYGVDHVRAPLAWGLYPRSFRRGTGPLVAVLDTGLDTRHPDLAGQWVRGARFWTEDCGSNLDQGALREPLAAVNLVDVCSDGNVRDTNGHGTGVASVVAARTNNRAGMASIAFNARILPIGCGDEKGRMDVIACAAAVVEAVNRGARVINMSFGGSTPSLSMLRAVELAYLEGAVLIAARGNARSTDRVYPACYPHVLGVSATDKAKKRAAFSSYGGGPLCTWVAAPGDGITVARAGTSTLGCPELGASLDYMACPGTSFAAPAVAAVAALAIGRDPSLTADDVADRLMRCSRDLGDPGYDDEFGYGLVDAYGMLTCA